MHWQQPAFLQHPLAREIALAIAIKLVVIAVLFYAFFAGRAAPVNDTRVAEHLAATQAAQTVSHVSTPAAADPAAATSVPHTP